MTGGEFMFELEDPRGVFSEWCMGRSFREEWGNLSLEGLLNGFFNEFLNGFNMGHTSIQGLWHLHQCGEQVVGKLSHQTSFFCQVKQRNVAHLEGQGKAVVR
jgi:hypothetical protein